MVDKDLASLSDQLMLGAVLLYVITMVAYAADLAFGRRRAVAASAGREPALVGAGAAGHPSTAGAADDTHDAAATTAESGESAESAEPAGTAPERREIDWARFAILMNVVAWGVHLGEIVTRGLAAHRWPWGNMYEFTSAVCFAAVTAYLVILTRQRVRFLGAFVMVAVIIGLGVATIWLYNDPGPLQPALNSYWIAIHVGAAISATGAFSVAAVVTVLYLLAARREATGRGGAGVFAHLPGAASLDRLAHKITMFAFPIWTFAIMAGAIWADQAWGRYWGWDPKETWSFITWVGYAGYLHARATAGWRGRKAAVISLIAFGSLLFNFFGINFLVSGLHSYAGG
ncbi:MAG TPA: c-type cytochrome biogenesis protein CcsB [Streptosporangiaceae bacterium]|nr:c-type cytochrome biogenesis protein CcsB [Streptosporangiaceae bacterium]